MIRALLVGRIHPQLAIVRLRSRSLTLEVLSTLIVILALAAMVTAGMLGISPLRDYAPATWGIALALYFTALGLRRLSRTCMKFVEELKASLVFTDVPLPEYHSPPYDKDTHETVPRLVVSYPPERSLQG